VIPVVDLRLKFGMEEIEYTERTCIIVVEIAGKGGDTLMGIVVDAVCEVLNIRTEDIEQTPTFGTALRTDFILGMAKMEGGVKILLDIDKALSKEEFEVASAAKNEDSPLPLPVAAMPEQATEQAAGMSEQAEM